MSKLMAKLRSLFRVEEVDSMALKRMDLRDPNQKEPIYTGPKLEMKPLIKVKDDE